MEEKPRPRWCVLPARRGQPRYGWALLRRDVVAGLTVATVAVPQAMAYALLAGVPPQYGLYTAIVMTALASMFGSSAHLINGPTNAISLVVFGVVGGVGTGPDDPSRIGLVAMLAVLAGLIQIALSLLKLGGLARRVPEAVVLGFMAGAGLLVALTEVPTVLGLEEAGTGEDHLLYRLWLTCSRGGPADMLSLAICLGTLALIAGLHGLSARLKVKAPAMILSLVLVSALVALLELAPAGGRTGPLHVEGGFPTPRLPVLPPGWLRELRWIGTQALVIAPLGLVEALAMARSLEAWSGQPLDCNRQCLAEGLANLGGGLFGCLPGSGSLSRSAVNYFAGAATRLSGVFSAAAVAAALGLFAPLAGFVPLPALAGVLLWTAWRIIDLRRLWGCLRSSRADAAIALSTAFAAVFIRVELAVLAGIASSLLCRALGGPARANGQPAPGGRHASPGWGVSAREVVPADSGPGAGEAGRLSAPRSSRRPSPECTRPQEVVSP
jgi:SulP family sulfate permease